MKIGPLHSFFSLQDKNPLYLIVYGIVIGRLLAITK